MIVSLPLPLVLFIETQSLMPVISQAVFDSMVTFLLGGHILLLLGLTASVFSIAGHYVGAGMVLKNGTKVIRPIILVVLALLFIKIIFNL